MTQPATTGGNEKKNSRKTCGVMEGGKACGQPASGSALTTTQRQRFTQSGFRFKRKSRATYYACEHHRSLVETVGKSLATKSVSASSLTNVPKVDWSVLSASSLKRYRQFFKLPDLPKQELQEVLSTHFTKQPIQELDTILGFLSRARHARTSTATQLQQQQQQQQQQQHQNQGVEIKQH